MKSIPQPNTRLFLTARVFFFSGCCFISTSAPRSCSFLGETQELFSSTSQFSWQDKKRRQFIEVISKVLDTKLPIWTRGKSLSEAETGRSSKQLLTLMGLWLTKLLHIQYCPGSGLRSVRVQSQIQTRLSLKTRSEWRLRLRKVVSSCRLHRFAALLTVWRL